MELKFRAWDTKRNNMLYYNSFHEFCSQYYAYYNQFLPLQYTGLKDRNGKEIYEGDIISFKRLKKENVPVVFIDDGFKISVKTGPCSTRTTGLNYLLSEYQCEVIGNIYEDLHLTN